ncbi:four helix bundle protein [Robertkochia sediminum]|uniref:four helix bundle protein n=1 Tax=Robertkochia sediminum TaxID=2785326 RepID=UPI0019317C4B|nr:four helix bundle protein [Robertkochia sediminum]MBL7473725.1 four helix bundle protein [Robertkochia sediminum]
MIHTELRVWNRSVDLVEVIYQVSNSFPKSEEYGLTAQMRRCAISIPSNIAEGAGRNSTKEFIRFLNISNGSLNELETQLVIAKRLKLIDSDTILKDHINPIRGMLFRLKATLQQKSSNS